MITRIEYGVSQLLKKGYSDIELNMEHISPSYLPNDSNLRDKMSAALKDAFTIGLMECWPNKYIYNDEVIEDAYLSMINVPLDTIAIQEGYAIRGDENMKEYPTDVPRGKVAITFQDIAFVRSMITDSVQDLMYIEFLDKGVVQ